MSGVYFVVDTTYLYELYKIPGYEEERYTKIRAKFRHALKNGHTLVVPFPVLFEMANHIAHANSGIRNTLSVKLTSAIKSSLSNFIPWLIPIDSGQSLLDVTTLLNICNDFCVEFSCQSIGLTDTSIIHCAKSISTSEPRSKVHIWTLDAALKPYEPHPDPTPYTA